MLLQSPIIITSRLLPGVTVGDGTLSIEYDGEDNEGRTVYRYFIDLEGYEYEGNDLKSGCQGGDLQGGLESLLSFLGACGEGYGYEMRGGGECENTDLFPDKVAEWCYQNSDELTMVGVELEETPGLIEE